MNYGYIERNKIVAPVAMRSRFNNIGGWHTLTDEQRAEHNWYPCDVINEGYDALRQVRSTFPEYTFDSATKRITATFTIVEKPLESVKVEQKQRITESRYECEVGGVLLGDTMLDTDRETQTRIAQAKVLVDNDPSLVIKWKKANGEWVELNHETITAMSLAIGKHVQQCFSKESELHAAIDACDNIDDVLNIHWE
jgi:hypothetical protein